MTPGFTIPDGIGPYATIAVVVLTALIGMLKSSRERRWEREDRAEERRRELEDATARQEELRLQIEAHANRIQDEVHEAKQNAELAFNEANHANLKIEKATEHLAAQAQATVLTTEQILELSQRFAALLEREGKERADTLVHLDAENNAQRQERADVAAQVAAVGQQRHLADEAAEQGRVGLQATADDTNARVQQIVPELVPPPSPHDPPPPPTVGEQIAETHERVTKTLKLEQDRDDERRAASP